MIKLNFPDFEFKLKKIDNKTFIFDFVRKKFILLTPEECSDNFDWGDVVEWSNCRNEYWSQDE